MVMEEIIKYKNRRLGGIDLEEGIKSLEEKLNIYERSYEDNEIEYSYLRETIEELNEKASKYLGDDK